MKKLFTLIKNTLEKGEALVLCSIIASSGSTPRGKGAKMVVFKDGSIAGTIGGGTVEFESIKLAQKAFEAKSAFKQSYNLTANETADIGMVCGGQVVVYFQYYSGDDENAMKLFRYMESVFNRTCDTWLINHITEGSMKQIGIYEEGKGMVFGEDICVEEIRPLLKSKGVLKRGEPTYYVEPLTQSATVYVFGGGHVSQELVPMIAHVGFRVVVYEDRASFADVKLFPQEVRTIVGPFNDIFSKITLTENDYVVIMTRGHQADYEVLEQVMRADVAYVGLIGSASKKASTFKRLIEAGISENDLDQIHTPIGIPIKGETPAEIAVSIAAEMILFRAEINEGKQ
ncbi:xanthine dehydrogenase accessory protein XdhC [Fusibacter ferrireducens]|uniref:Xanthine dehydrogenase accessory protein XdhC n=1 Tax=Fusibacter ferrireducens TaxID=2785058 RepID=A0ABR9ZRE6_9FIRM|nr:xanthine dehydrogenase accessory protein XdhC [Fusibacter ferrireducens]MBF4692505.1 xanthine dehydrogenase accessory protein XdhC [Fusibacter ferrireducens]